MVLRGGRDPLRADLLGRRLRPDRPRAARARLARRGDLLHLGPHEQRGGVPLSALRAACSARTTCPTARTCATSRAASAWATSIGVGKGTVTLDDFDAGRRHLRHRPEPRHEPPADAHRARRPRRGAGATSSASTRCASAALDRFAHPQDVRDLLTGGTAIAELFLPVRINGDVALLKGIMKEVLEEERRRPARCSTGPSSPSTRPASTSSPPRSRRVSWDEIVEQSGVDRDADPRGRREIYVDAERVIACWAMGLTQHKNGGRQHPGGRQPAPAPRQHRQARRGGLPGARAQQRAGRPHDGHLRAPLGRLPRPPRPRRSASSRRASTATTSSRRSRRCTRAARASSSPWAATSSPPRPTPRTPPRPCAAAG